MPCWPFCSFIQTGWWHTHTCHSPWTNSVTGSSQKVGGLARKSTLRSECKTTKKNYSDWTGWRVFWIILWELAVSLSLLLHVKHDVMSYLVCYTIKRKLQCLYKLKVNVNYLMPGSDYTIFLSVVLLLQLLCNCVSSCCGQNTLEIILKEKIDLPADFCK